MTAVLRTAAVALLLAGPTVLAFRSGGYFDDPRLVAGIVAWVLVGVAAIAQPVVVPRRAPARLALGGLALLTLVVGLSITWAPMRAPAQADLERLLLYLGAFLAGLALLRRPAGLRLVEPVLAAGAFVVIGYAIAGRLLPGILRETSSLTAAGRLEQPLTYWNATGILAVAGMLLAVRLAGDATRDVRVRAAGAAAAVPFGLAVYLTFSRGALLTLALGLVLLVVLSRERAQARAALAALGLAAAASVVAGLLGGVRALEGPLGHREAQGAVMLVALLLLMALGAELARRFAARGPEPVLSAPRVLAAAVVLILLAGFFAVAAGHGSSGGQPRVGADTRRLASFESNRYDYWKVAGRMFTDHPLVGDGSASFRVAWRRERTIDDPALDAHSLYVETAGELGLLGLLALGLLLGGVAWACVLALRRERAVATGAVAALAAFAVHAGLDWDWEMPAVALVALLLAAAVCAAVDEG